MSLLSPCRLVSRGESLKSYDVFKNNRKISVSISNRNWYMLCIVKTYGGNCTMKYEQSMLSEYISEGGGHRTSVNRIILNGNILYQVVKNGEVLGNYSTECDAEAVAEESVL